MTDGFVKHIEPVTYEQPGHFAAKPSTSETQDTRQGSCACSLFSLIESGVGGGQRKLELAELCEIAREINLQVDPDSDDRNDVIAEKLRRVNHCVESRTCNRHARPVDVAIL